MSPVVERRSDFRHGLPAAQAEFHSISTAPERGGPIGDRHGFSVEWNPPRRSLIVGLLTGGRPADIPRLISTFIVNAVKRHAFWASSYVREKCCEVVSPLIANSDSATAPAVKLGHGSVEASVLHSRPNLIFPDVSQTMSPPGVAKSFVVVAPARSCSAAVELVGHNARTLPAIAKAIPPRDRPAVGVFSTFCAGLHKESAKSAAC